MVNVPVSAAASWLGDSWKRDYSIQAFFNPHSNKGELDPSGNHPTIPLPGVRQLDPQNPSNIGDSRHDSLGKSTRTVLHITSLFTFILFFQFSFTYCEQHVDVA